MKCCQSNRLNIHFDFNHIASKKKLVRTIMIWNISLFIDLMVLPFIERTHTVRLQKKMNSMNWMHDHSFKSPNYTVARLKCTTKLPISWYVLIYTLCSLFFFRFWFLMWCVMHLHHFTKQTLIFQNWLWLLFWLGFALESYMFFNLCVFSQNFCVTKIIVSNGLNVNGSVSDCAWLSNIWNVFLFFLPFISHRCLDEM